MVETRIGETMRYIVNGDDKTRAKGREVLAAEGRKRERVLGEIRSIADNGSCMGINSKGNNGNAREILKQHLSIEKAEAEGMIDGCIEEKKNATSLDVILENDGFQREEERRLCRINKALEKLENGEIISLGGLMPAHKIEHLESLIERSAL